MPRQTFFPNPQRKPSGFSPATRVGNMVFISGHTSVDTEGNVVGKGDPKVQSEQTFRNVEAALKASGATLDDVTKITAFLINSEDYSAYSAVRLKLFPENGPASSSVFIKGLVHPDLLVEIEAIAIVQ